MEITPDQVIYGHWGPLPISATLLCTWLVMALLAGAAWFLSRGLRTDGTLTRGQNILEAVVSLLLQQIRDVSGQRSEPVLPFVGTLFLFIFVSNVLTIVPGFRTPTGSLSTTAALALTVFVAVPVFGIQRHGLRGYLAHYAQPSLFVLPFTVMGELTRTLALALRLFGNMMSGAVAAALLLSLAPLFFPAIMQGFGLLIGTVQAYIFAVLATVYIASATRAHDDRVASSSPESIRRNHG